MCLFDPRKTRSALSKMRVVCGLLLALGAVLPASAAASPAPSAGATAPPARATEIVRLRPGVSPEAGRALIDAAGGSITTDLHIINGYGVRVSDAARRRL